MTEVAPPAGFCPNCGARVEPGANFCIACGAALRPSGPRAPRHRPEALGLAVLGGFLALGLGLWFAILRPEADPGRRPLAPKGESATAPTTGGELPQDHPPLEIPADVRRFIAELETKAEGAPKDLPTWKTLGDVAYRAGQIDRAYLATAERAYARVLEIDPKDPGGLRGLGNVHYDREQYPKARDLYLRYLEIEPKDSSVRTDLGTMYLYDGHPDQAIAEYRKVLAADPKFYQAHFNLGVALARKGETEEAVAELEQAKALAPDEATKGQIQQMIARAALPAAPAEAGAEKTALQARVERSLRSHPIVGPKIAGFEWPSESAGRVLLDDFPMQAMPETVRAKFLERLKTELASAKRESGASGPASLELVDRRTGSVLSRVDAD